MVCLVLVATGNDMSGESVIVMFMIVLYRNKIFMEL